MDKDRIRYLLERYGSGMASREEVEEMFGWLQLPGSEEVLKQLIPGLPDEGEGEVPVTEEAWRKIWLGIRTGSGLSELTGEADRSVVEMAPGGVGMRRKYRLWTAAAAVLLILAGSVYWTLSGIHAHTRRVMPVSLTYRNDIAPGGNRAILTLANGNTILLDSAHDGALARQGNTSIMKTGAGVLAYNSGGLTGGEGLAGGEGIAEAGSAANKGGVGNGAVRGGEMMYNSIATPAGGQYRIVLPDGSKVWLNAASSLRFPTAFSGKERRVELQGEAYFEIADNAAMPFRVSIPAGKGVSKTNSGTGGSKADILVLGTHFNVMAYDNEEAIHTTLLEGAVKVMAQEKAVRLEPGHQASIDNLTHDMNVSAANTEQVIAWKEGIFRFRETGIHELMRQVERWYSVEVVFQTDGKDQDYTGVVSREQPVSALLKTLELTGTVHFRIEGRKIIVLP